MRSAWIRKPKTCTQFFSKGFTEVLLPCCLWGWVAAFLHGQLCLLTTVGADDGKGFRGPSVQEPAIGAVLWVWLLLWWCSTDHCCLVVFFFNTYSNDWSYPLCPVTKDTLSQNIWKCILLFGLGQLQYLQIYTTLCISQEKVGLFS